MFPFKLIIQKQNNNVPLIKRFYSYSNLNGEIKTNIKEENHGKIEIGKYK